ncbi:MAG: hypothetical protein M3Y87_24325, partial [Myxococcota bacterium]|nr:hypothetical protein [Myxococcota bacterium]
ATQAAEVVVVAEPDAGPSMVSVRVLTSPAGARVWIVGRGDVCQETPCSFETAPGEAITVRVRRGRSEGEVELTPEAGDAPEITIPMRSSGGGGGHSKQSGDREPSGGGGGHGDLKIPDVFRRPR